MANNAPMKGTDRQRASERLVQAARRYLLDRRSRDGGFCYYRSVYLDEPNLSDTYYAVSALELIGSPPESGDSLVHFATRFIHVRQALARYHAASLLRCVQGAEFQPQQDWVDELSRWTITAPPGRDSPQLTAWLNRTRTLVRLKNDFTAFHDRDRIALTVRALEHPAGGFGNCPNMLDAATAIDILAHCEGTPVRLPLTRQFVDSLQVPFIAFTLTPSSSTTNVDVIFSGLHCCIALDIPVRFVAEASSFVKACQAGNGGFARAPSASATIELTYKALWSLRALDPEILK